MRKTRFTSGSIAGSEHAEDTAPLRCGSEIADMLDIATRFQRSALPKALPQVEGLTFDSYYEPAAKAQLVGGDW